tara:strand:- start:580 stop:1149 length:570 start_codon:yes stop_codon:yes gene_type:complete
MTNTPNFIEIYDNALSPEQCRQIITEFELDKISQEVGKCGDGVVENVKKSTDIIHYLNDCSLASSIINFALAQPLDHYKKKYPEIDKIATWSFHPDYHVQRYRPNEGYFEPHCEVMGAGYSANRVLVWMYYLNDVNNGGTRFTNFDIDIEAKAGRLVLWAPYWTHVHHGIVSSTETKYIATGWYSFVDQ